jgi:hypothetical protein
MRVSPIRVIAVVMLTLTTVSPAFAHHFFPRASDVPIPLTGTVQKFLMQNPHSMLYLGVKDATGKIATVEIQLGSVQGLIGRGWGKTTLKAGDVVTVQAIRGSGKDNLYAAQNITLPGGRVLFGGSHVGDKATS